MTAFVAPPFPLNPAVGDTANGYVWNGSMWVPMSTTAGGMQVVTTVFTLSGTYMPSAGLVTVVVECVGGGGGGGAAGPLTLATYVAGGGGGGSGSYSRKTLPAALVLGGVIVTVGGGGVGGPSGSSGGVGGVTSFGALCVANGGGSGMYNNITSNVGVGGLPGPAGTGDIALPGNAGFQGPLTEYATSNTYVAPPGGYGAAGYYGGAPIQSGPGNGSAHNGSAAAANTGAGGGGGCVNQAVVGTVATGGNGGSGICVVNEYCLSGAGGGGCGQAPVAITGCGPGWGGPC